MIEIKNTKRRMFSYNLEAPHFKNKKGEMGKGNPESITFLSLEKKPCDEEILECDEIKGAINNGDLRVVQTVENKPKRKSVSSE